MQRNCLFWSLVFSGFIFLSPDVRAEAALEDDVRVMKTQFEKMQKRMGELEEKVAAQERQIAGQEATKQVYEKRIGDLEKQLAQKPEAAVPTASPRSPVLKWVPDIGVVADTVFTSTSAKTDDEGANRLSLRELELILGSAVDPYSRLDATIAFSDTEEPSLEEAYLTRFGLPLDTTARVGKFKPHAGKVLGLHRDSLDTVDEPLAVRKYFGVEGMSKSGLDLTGTLALPWPVTQQVTMGILEGGSGEEGTAFGETRRRPTIYSHLKNYWDVTDDTGFEMGFSHMIGSRDEDAGFEVQVLAADVTLTQQFNVDQRMKFQAEAFNLNRKESFLDVEEDDGRGGTVVTRRSVDGNLWGAYGLVDFKIHPSWSTGFRYDYVQPVDNPFSNPHDTEVGQAGYITFHQSEFARWRLQYTHTDLATGKDDNTVYLQGTFSIGEHKHKLQ